MRHSRLAVVGAAVLLMHGACGDDDSPAGPSGADSPIVGTWIEDDTGGEIWIVFQADGTFQETDEGELTTGTWELAGSALTMRWNITEFELTMITMGTAQIDGSTMALTGECGTVTFEGGTTQTQALVRSFVEAFCGIEVTYTQQ